MVDDDINSNDYDDTAAGANDGGDDYYHVASELGKRWYFRCQRYTLLGSASL